MIIVANCFCFIPRFSIFGKPAGYARFPRGTYRHPRIIRERSTTLPALSVFADRHGKVQYPLWFHDVPHGWCPEAFTRQHVSMADNRQNDTQPVQPSQPPMASKSIPNPTGPLQTAQISWLMVQSRLRRHRPNSRNGQLRSMISALSASSRSRTPMADRIAGSAMAWWRSPVRPMRRSDRTIPSNRPCQANNQDHRWPDTRSR